MIFYLYFCNIKTTIQTKEQSKGEKQPFFLNPYLYLESQNNQK